FDRTVDLELQADCFAGGWTAWVADGRATGFEPGDIDLDKTVAGMLAIRDEPGTSPDDVYAHGSGFDRVSAFQDGFENGAGKCAEYADEDVDRRTAEIEDPDVLASGGDWPLEDGPLSPDGEGLLTKLERDLNSFYTRLFDELGTEFTPVGDLVLADPATDAIACGGDTLSGDELDYAALYCEDEHVVVLDGEGLVESLNDLGDFAVASEVARLWAIAAQTQLGVVDGDEAGLQADCLTGRWAAWTFPRTPEGGSDSDELTMSAGDLDEGIMGFLAYGAGFGDDGRTVFERTAALRTGFFEGYGACEEYGPLG
ncbi:MAG: neutral zinc metallopeptidase, partial [Acidimicrobiales bacterium]|nr:neutral zinc metallopeptidase [Acidimicrobiales bacterium]